MRLTPPPPPPPPPYPAADFERTTAHDDVQRRISGDVQIGDLAAGVFEGLSSLPSL